MESGVVGPSGAKTCEGERGKRQEVGDLEIDWRRPDMGQHVIKSVFYPQIYEFL